MAEPSAFIEEWRMNLLKPKTWTLSQREAAAAYLYTIPWVIGFIIFTAGPMLTSLYYSFTKFNIIDPPVWIGLENYINLFNNPIFWQSVKVTFYYASLALPLGLIVGFILAVLLNQEIWGQKIWRTIYFLPSVIAGVAVALMWVRLLNPNIGLVNAFLRLFGIQGPGWLQDPQWSVPSLVLMSLWSVGGSMIIYLAGLQGIPTALYEAAKIDGANAFQRFQHITIPMMTPIIFYNLVLGLITTFQLFTEVFVATGAGGAGNLGGPARSTMVYNLYLYLNAFRYFDMGTASAMAWILFLFILVITIFLFRSSSFWVYYEGQLSTTKASENE
jgi:multiple sugar transport system permease protein